MSRIWLYNLTIQFFIFFYFSCLLGFCFISLVYAFSSTSNFFSLLSSSIYSILASSNVGYLATSCQRMSLTCYTLQMFSLN